MKPFFSMRRLAIRACLPGAMLAALIMGGCSTRHLLGYGPLDDGGGDMAGRGDGPGGGPDGTGAGEGGPSSDGVQPGDGGIPGDACVCLGSCGCACDPGAPICPAPPPHVRGSLKPVVELATLDNMDPGDRFPIGTVDITTAPGASAYLSITQKLSDVESQINAELQEAIDAGQLTGVSPVTVFRAATPDSSTAQRMIFRGKPSSVALAYQRPGTTAADAGSPTQAFVTLGGDIGIVGNEVAVVDLANLASAPALVRVGVRPHRVVRHPSNLIFVLNRYSNYISVIDPAAVPIGQADRNLEVSAEYFSEDAAFEMHASNFDRSFM
jgi:hypothetical protein